MDWLVFEINPLTIAVSTAVTLAIIRLVKWIEKRQKLKSLERFWDIQFSRLDAMIRDGEATASNLRNVLDNFESVKHRVSEAYDEMFYTRYLERLDEMHEKVEDEKTSDYELLANGVREGLRGLVFDV